MFKLTRFTSHIVPAVFKQFQLRKKLSYAIHRRVAAATILTVITMYAFDKMKMIEDQTIKKIKEYMKKEMLKLRNQYGQMGIYPEPKIELKGDTYFVQFQVDQRKCDIFSMMTNAMSVFNSIKGFKVLDYKSMVNTNGIVTSYIEFEENDPQFRTPQKGRITITGIKNNQFSSFRFIFQKNGLITPKDYEALSMAYREVVKPKALMIQEQNTSLAQKMAGKKTQKENSRYKNLRDLGLTVFDPNEKIGHLDWDYLAGYESQKRSIEDTVLLALNYPQMYDEIAEGTRMKYEPNRPKAVLFQGPPGTGKTTSAKIIAQQVKIPLIYLPIEAIMSKYYGESQTKLAAMWEECKKLGKSIIFIDQIDALASNRDSDMHQASRRILSTLLRKIDSFESTTDVLLICATNRKKDLDPAMLSRIDLSIKFALPDIQSRAAIFKRYAKHLTDQQLQKLAFQTANFSGRNISDVCKNAERRWASKLIRKEVSEKLPNFEEYLGSLKERKLNELN